MSQVPRLFVFAAIFLFLHAITPCFAQQSTDQDPETTGAEQTSNPSDPKQQTTPSTPKQQTAGQKGEKQINVNWLYGSFVPKDVPLVPLTPHQRFQLYLNQTYITYGIYIKTVLFAANGQIKNSPPEWEGASGFGKRMLSYQGQFIIQNSISSAGNALVGWEPRYERCRCEGIKSRTWHAVKRNFVTYNSTDSSLRPQLMPYLGAAGSAAIASVAWLPGSQQPGTKAYQAAITQVFVGVTVDLVAEYAPEWGRLIHRDKNKKKNAGTPNQH
jgi:hypothetical protein